MEHKETDPMPKTTSQEWLLIFYSVPSHPVSNRMKIWRKLAKIGAVQLKGAVYLLPALRSMRSSSMAHWEVKSMAEISLSEEEIKP
jgi:hypothetical protein